ncbi:MAG TPA: UDP-N-acetylglucosamine 1-carboxyvinyltransferase [Gaiellaceae bacterium]|nr:UDP-N-acetylglucosamine 1-carboxyvinyltransferase [Gaiellaceae bacterium]
MSSTIARPVAESFVIEGGRPLQGRVRASGNKNGVLPILAACLLTDEPVQLANVPRIRDVDTMSALLRNLGADVEWTGDNELRVHAQDVGHEVDEHLASRIRASFLLAGPLLARHGRASVPPPGGDVIGRRRLDPHIHAFAELGASIDIGERYEISGRLKAAHIHLDEASVMGTENAVMAATLAPGKTMISNAASEPHVQDLCRFLVSLGAKIDGIGSNVLHVSGVERLFGGEHSIGPEHIEVGSFIGMAAVTGGDVTIEGITPDDMWPVLPVFRRLGIEVEQGDDWVRVPPGQQLAIKDDLGGAIPKVEDGPWPQFPADLTSIAVVVATQAKGTVLIFEKMFESRLFFVDKLVSMGARIILCDPHRVVITGPAPLYGQRMSSPDIRAGMAMVIAALCAEGTSTIGDAYQIDKGYERIDERLRGLGAQIQRVES